MGNHYRLVVQFDKPCEMDPNGLRAWAEVLYPGKKGKEMLDNWPDEQWEHFRHRIFEIQEQCHSIPARGV